MPGLWKSIPQWLLDPKGPTALRLTYAVTFLPWAVKFLRAGKVDGLDAIGDAMMALTRRRSKSTAIICKAPGARTRARLRLCACLPKG